MKYNKEFITQLEFLCGTKFNDMQQDSIKDFLKRNDKKHESKTMRSTEYSPKVEEVYAVYPTKCPIRKVSTGKNTKCKSIISKLLESHSASVIIAEIKSYTKECVEGNVYMRNFLTYLNGFHVEEYIEIDTSNDVVKYLYNGSVKECIRKEVPAGAIVL